MSTSTLDHLAPTTKMLLDHERLQELTVAVQNLRLSISKPLPELQRDVASCARRLFRAESASLFVQMPTRKGYLELVTSTPIAPSETLRVPITEKRGAGVTGALGLLRQVTVYSRSQLLSHPSYAGRLPIHLPSRNCHSLLAIPILDRKDFLLALLKIDNKLNADGQEATDVPFDQVDILIANILKEQVGAVLESAQRRQTLLTLAANLTPSKATSQALADVVEAAVHLTNADRADLAVLNERDQGFVVAAQYSDDRCRLTIGSPTPKQGFVYSLWKSGEKFRIATDVAAPNIPYFPAHPDTRCELAMVISPSATFRSVLNIESFRVGGLDEHDVPILTLLEPLVGQILDRDSSDWDLSQMPMPSDIAWLVVRARLGVSKEEVPLRRLFGIPSPGLLDILGLKRETSFQQIAEILGAIPCAQEFIQALLDAVLAGDARLNHLSPTEVPITSPRRPTKYLKVHGFLRGRGEAICVFRDVTEFSSRHQIFEEYLPLLPFSYSTVDAGYQYVSPAMARLYGYGSAEEFSRSVGRPEQLYVKPERRRELLDALSRQDYVTDFEFAAWKHDPLVNQRVAFWVSQTVRRFGTPSEPQGWKLLATYVDITERKALERKLVLAGAAGMLLHDARGPLGRALTKAAEGRKRIKKATLDLPDADAIFASIQDECESGDQLCMDWLKIAKGEAAAELKVQNILPDLKAIAEQAWYNDGIKATFAGENPREVLVKYNAQFLVAAFRQIFRNAKKAMRDLPTKECIVRLEDDGIRLVIVTDDHGGGFRSDKVGSGWRAIASLCHSESDRGGLGLVICNAIIEIFGGELMLGNWHSPSGSLGGARVIISLPKYLNIQEDTRA